MDKPPSLTIRTAPLPAGGVNDPATPLYHRDLTPLDDMNKFRCWKVMTFIAGAILTVVGAVIAAGGFAALGIGGLVSTPIGACICAAGTNMMVGTGLLMYVDHTTTPLPPIISGPTLISPLPEQYSNLLIEPE